MSVLSSEGRALRAAPASVNLLSSPLFFWGVLGLYLVLHIALRLWETPNLGKNDVQEALAAQGWAWGYHPRNPPLHTWLLMASYGVFGVGLLAHVVLKYVLLGAVYVFAYLSGRRLLSSRALATVAAFSVTLLTPFAWTVHTALTHTLLLAVVIFATLWAAIRLTQRQAWRDYILFGAVIGLGFLAKYSYPLFLLPLMAAMLSQAELRRAIVSPKFLGSLAVAALAFAPHAAWMMEARFDFVQFLSEKQHNVAPAPYLVDAGLGLGNVAAGALTFLAPLLLLAGMLFWRLVRASAARPSSWTRALSSIPLFGLGLLVLDVLVLRATQFEERYFMCSLLVAPIALFAWVDQRGSALGRNTLAKFAAGTLVVASIVGAGLAGRALYYGESCSRCWEEMAAPALARQVRVAAGFQYGTIIADHYNVAGNVALAFPEARVIAANYVVEEPLGDPNGQCLLVWNARNAGDRLPDSLAEYLIQHHVPLPSGKPTYIDALLLRSTHRMDRFAYWLATNADGNCQPRSLIGQGRVTASF